jgi:hypothetical protein
MTNLLSIITFLPIVAAIIMALFLRGGDEAAARNAKWLALLTTTATFIISLFVLFRFDPANTGFQFVEDHPWIMGLRYKMGVDGISVLFVLLTTFMMPLTILSTWHVETGQGIHDRLPGAGRADDRRLHRAGSGAVLPVLRGRADPDVPDHRHLGRQGPHLCGLQVLPLYLPRLGADAGGDDRHVSHGRHHRYRAAAGLTTSRPRPIACWALRSSAARRRCCSWPSSPASRSRCRCGRSIPGCPTPTFRRRPPVRSCWPRCC